MDESSWKKNYILSVFTLFLKFKSFQPWLACFNSDINDLEKSKLVKIVANWGHLQWLYPVIFSYNHWKYGEIQHKISLCWSEKPFEIEEYI